MSRKKEVLFTKFQSKKVPKTLERRVTAVRVLRGLVRYNRFVALRALPGFATLDDYYLSLCMYLHFGYALQPINGPYVLVRLINLEPHRGQIKSTKLGFGLLLFN